jgi:DNA-binding ferritin-like protein
LDEHAEEIFATTDAIAERVLSLIVWTLVGYPALHLFGS